MPPATLGEMRRGPGCVCGWPSGVVGPRIGAVDAVVLMGLLVLGVVVLTPVADRVGVPQPVLLTVYGIILGFLPGVPAPDLPPELILPLVLPPLLFFSPSPPPPPPPPAPPRVLPPSGRSACFFSPPPRGPPRCESCVRPHA